MEENVNVCTVCGSAACRYVVVWKHFGQCNQQNVTTEQNMTFVRRVAMDNIAEIDVENTNTQHTNNNNQQQIAIKRVMYTCALCGFTACNFEEFEDHGEQQHGEQCTNKQQAVFSQFERQKDVGKSSSAAKMIRRKYQQTATNGKNKNNIRGRGNKKCPHCNFVTCMPQLLRRHLDAHNRHGQMYQCDICQVEFSQQANMKRHRVRHAGYKPFQCVHCLKQFFRKDQALEHTITHIRRRGNFNCPVANCKQLLRRDTCLKRHLDEEHFIAAGKPAYCKCCSFLFYKPQRLMFHYWTRHEDGGASVVKIKPNKKRHMQKPNPDQTAECDCCV